MNKSILFDPQNVHCYLQKFTQVIGRFYALNVYCTYLISLKAIRCSKKCTKLILAMK